MVIFAYNFIGGVIELELMYAASGDAVPLNGVSLGVCLLDSQRRQGGMVHAGLHSRVLGERERLVAPLADRRRTKLRRWFGGS